MSAIHAYSIGANVISDLACAADCLAMLQTQGEAREARIEDLVYNACIGTCEDVIFRVGAIETAEVHGVKFHRGGTAADPRV